MPVIPSLVLTNQLPINTYTASVVTSASVYQNRPSAILTDGLGNQLLLLDATSSYALTSSYEQDYEISSSYASASSTSSYALNIPLIFPYETISSKANNFVTISINTASNQQWECNTAATYSFTGSNVPTFGNISDFLLYMSNSAVLNTHFLYPSNWINVAGGWPEFIQSQSVAVFWFRAIDTNKVIGSFSSQ